MSVPKNGMNYRHSLFSIKNLARVTQRVKSALCLIRSVDGLVGITVTLWWGRWCLKSPAPRLFTQPFAQALIKKSIKAPRYWPLWGEFTGDRWFPEKISIWWRHHVLCFSMISVTSSQWIHVIYLLHFCLTHLPPGQSNHHFTDGIFKSIFLNVNVWISLKTSLKFVPKVRNNTIPLLLVQIMPWCRPGAKPLSEPMIVYRRTYASLGLNEALVSIGSDNGLSPIRHQAII